MRAILLVGNGGLVGSIARYKAGGWVEHDLFSALGVDALYLLRRGDLMIAASYLVLSVVLGVGAVWLGWKLISSAGVRA